MWSVIHESRVRRVTAECLGVRAEELSASVQLLDDLAVDALDLADLAAMLENEFHVAVPDEALVGVRTYEDLVGAVDELVRCDARRRIERYEAANQRALAASRAARVAGVKA